MSEQEIKDRLKLLLWDSPATVEDVYALLMHDRPCRMAKPTLCQKIPDSFKWYTVREIIPEEKMGYAFSDDVLNGLFPPSIRDNYRHARQFL